MVDLTNILGGPWSPPAAPRVDPPELQLADAMRAAGITPPQSIQLDGKLHRFRSGTKGTPGHGDKTGWVVAYGDGVPAGKFGCWRAGIEMTWRADVGRTLTVPEEMAHARRMREAQAARDEALRIQRDVVADTTDLIWSQGTPANPEHPYLARKGIAVHGSRVTGDGRLMVPLYTPEGKLASLQYIDPEGGKLYHAGGQTGSCSWMLGTMDEPGILYVAEGFATAATIHEVTGRPCIISYSASNIVPIMGTLRARYGTTQEIVIVADNDKSGVGAAYATQAVAKHGGRVVMPPAEGDANDYRAAGGNLRELLTPPTSDWLVPADDFCTEPAPIRWLVKHWLQEEALIMVHGPSGGGKTFAVLDWSLHIAAGLPDWHGHKVKPGAVVYLAGEGHHGLRSRVAAWKQHNRAGKLDMWVSRAGCDLNTAEGYQKAVQAIRALPRPPSLINVDTLHRFLSGDENSAQDAKTMIDACAGLMREFNCSVCLVHHTGVSDEAQHRARGSSAWKGALEIEISVIPGKGDAPMQIVQRKSKDAEEAQPVYVTLESVPIKGWLDEDGEQVTSAVLMAAEAPREPAKDGPEKKAFKAFEAAWWDSGAENPDGLPYISRSAWLAYLEKNSPDKAVRTLRNRIDPSRPESLTAILIHSGIMERHGEGYRIISDAHASPLNAAKLAPTGP